MPKYIDAYKLLKHWTFSESGKKFPLHDCDNFPVTVPIKDVQNSIINSKPEDVEPVVHAHGEPFERFGMVMGWKCSHCGKEMATLAQYCPHCGARMDEQEKT